MNLKRTKAFRWLMRYMSKNYPVLLTKLRFRKYFGRPINLNPPLDLNEKILWLSLYTDTTEWSRLADKYAVREYVKDCGLENILVPLYGKWDDAHDIDWNELPQSFILKTNNGSSGTIMVVKDKSKIDTVAITEKFAFLMNKPEGLESTEPHYSRIKPCIIAEQLLENTDEIKKISSTLVDYKIWCFNGKADSIWTCSNRQENGACVATFDKDWNYHPEGSVFTSDYMKQDHLVPKPSCLDRMLEIAEILAKPFPIVRVDLYCIGDKVYFGEMTFTSNGGMMDFYTQEYLLEMGSKADLSGMKKDRVNKTFVR